MNTRTWNLTLMANEHHGETMIERVSHEVATNILRGLMHGPGSPDYEHVAAAAKGARARRRDDRLAA